MRLRFGAAVGVAASLVLVTAVPALAETAPDPVWSAARVATGVEQVWTHGPASVRPLREAAGVLLTATRTVDANNHYVTGLTGLDAGTGAVRWSDPAATATVPQVVGVAGSRVFVAGLNPLHTAVTALDAATGATLWTAGTGLGSAAVTGDELVVADTGGVAGTVTTTAYDAATGATRWSRTGVDDVLGAGGRLYATVSPDPDDPGAGDVYGLDPATGATRWQIRTDGPPDLRPLSDGDLLVVDSGPPATYTAYAGDTGAQRWSRPVEGADIGQVTDGSWADGGGVLYEVTNVPGVAEDSPSHLWALDEATGEIRWSVTDGQFLKGAPAVGAGSVLVPCPLGVAYQTFACAFDASTGAALGAAWAAPFRPSDVDPYGQAPFLLAGNRLFVNGYDGVHALTPADLLPVPGKIEAESTVSPALRGTADDTGGGQLIGLFPPGGTVLDYPVDVAAAGTYSLTFRVSSGSPPTPGAFDVQVLGVGTVAHVDVPDTGGWQSWRSVTVTATLPAGAHLLRLYIPAGGDGFDLNWFDAEPAGGA